MIEAVKNISSAVMILVGVYREKEKNVVASNIGL
jgi:hypothetical protein